MFGTKKKDTPRPLNDSGRSQVSESFALEGTLRTSGAIDIAGLIKGGVYTNDLIIKERGITRKSSYPVVIFFIFFKANCVLSVINGVTELTPSSAAFCKAILNPVGVDPSSGLKSTGICSVLICNGRIDMSLRNLEAGVVYLIPICSGGTILGCLFSLTYCIYTAG